MECRKCGAVVRDKFFRDVPPVIRHCQADESSKCRGRMDQVFLPRAARNPWSDKDAVVVFKKADGSISYPPRNDLPTPAGCERVVMRSLSEVNRFERDNHVCCEVAHFDRGNEMPTVDRLDVMPSIERRREAFVRAWRG